MKNKYSKQREKILEIVMAFGQHLSADKIYDELKKEFPKISLATVYRNLNILVRQNKIRTVSAGSTTYYDPKNFHHYHFICKSCGKIEDVDELLPETYLNHITSNMPHHIQSHALKFYGICNNCFNNK